MKSLNYIITVALLSAIHFANAQSEPKKTETTEFKVEGVCNQCKERIEKSLDTKGIRFAEWDKQTKMVKVIYSPKKITIDEIHQILANKGHNTDKIQASEEDYKKLPACCKYKSNTTH